MDYLIGFFIGVLSGVIPLVIGLLMKYKLIAVIGAASTILSALLFVFFDKSPFTSIGVAVVFLIVIFIKNKNKNNTHEDHENDDHDIYLGDD